MWAHKLMCCLSGVAHTLIPTRKLLLQHNAGKCNLSNIDTGKCFLLNSLAEPYVGICDMAPLLVNA